MLEALGRRYDSDQRIAWVELGSLGHDGSWRVDRAEGVDPLPLSDIVTEYVWHYTRAFPNTRLLMSRPFSEAHLLGLGLYNDNLGDEDKSWEWLDFVRFGGYDDQLSAMLRPMEPSPINPIVFIFPFSFPPVRAQAQLLPSSSTPSAFR